VKSGPILLAGVVLSACVTQNGPRTGPLPATPAPGIVAAPAMVMVDAREYLGEITAGPLGVALSKDGAEQVPGGSVKVFRPGLSQSDGIEAKAAAVAVCAQAKGTFNTGVQQCGWCVQYGGAGAVCADQRDRWQLGV
jgi:hypothetical protein